MQLRSSQIVYKDLHQIMEQGLKFIKKKYVQQAEIYIEVCPTGRNLYKKYVQQAEIYIEVCPTGRNLYRTMSNRQRFIKKKVCPTGRNLYKMYVQQAEIYTKCMSNRQKFI